MVPRVRRALDLMASRLGGVEATKGASKVKTQALSSHLQIRVGWTGIRGGVVVSLHEDKKTQENISNGAGDSQNDEQVARGDLNYFPKAFIPRKRKHYAFFEFKIPTNGHISPITLRH